AQADRFRAAQPVQHLLRARPGRRARPQHPQVVLQTGSVRPGRRDPDADAGRGAGHQSRSSVRAPRETAPVRGLAPDRAPARTAPGAAGRGHERVLRLMAKLVAIADAHLGRAHYQAVDPNAVLVLGDLFDAPRPTYRAFREGARGLRTLAAAGVPTLAISGNHETPRLRESGSPYAVLADAFPGLRFVYRGGYEPVDLLDGLRVHAVPQCSDDLALKQQIAAAAAARSGDHLNLLVTHGAVTVRARRYTYGDVNELEVDLSTLDAGFDRILLGHFHNFAKVAPNAWYPGSTDTFSFKDLPASDEPQVKGILSLDTSSGTVRHPPVPGGRPLRSYRLDAFDLTAPEVYEAAAGLAAPSE